MSSSWGRWLGGALGAISAVGTGMLVYGALVESNRLVIEHHTLELPNWPEELIGYRIALLGDFHISHKWSVELGKRAISAALAEAPDIIVLVGDFVNYWSADSIHELAELLEPLELMRGDVIAVPGNHDYYGGDPDLLETITREFGIRLLRNESIQKDGIVWVGIDSAREGEDDLRMAFAMAETSDLPRIVVWHEPDVVDRLPRGCALQLSGHSHGGQFRLPFGITPMHSQMGSRYPRGYYPDASTPLYVTRGIGTTGPPSRMLCPPELAILTLV